MSLRLEMLQVARLAPRLLQEASGRVAEYLAGEFDASGGVRDLQGRPDLYYTVFGLAGMAAVQEPPPVEAVRGYLEGFGDGEELDLVHVASLARCWASLDGVGLEPQRIDALRRRLEAFRSEDGGYAAEPGARLGGVYQCFLAHGALEDLGGDTGDAAPLLDCVRANRTADGAYGNGPDMPQGTTPVTAAAVTLLRHLGQDPPGEALAWLGSRVASDGGFLAAPAAPMPDLLSTATALHALDGEGLEELREPCLDFVDTLWTGRGFCGTWADDEPDPEYTFYGLLALGHLAL